VTDASIQIERAPEAYDASVCGLISCSAKDLPIAVLIVADKQNGETAFDNGSRTDGCYIGRIVEGPLSCGEIMRVSVHHC